MKKLTVLLATLLVFFSADAQQILSGIYSGSMYNDTTKMLTKYELALSEYRGKVFGYSYNTFIVNDTFYYGIRRVKGYKTDKGELVLEDEELLANNFPESPAKRIKRTATFQLAEEDTITSLNGAWQTNRTRQYYSVGGATKTERSVDSSQSPLVAHLKELNIISDKPNYQDDAVVKNKKKDEKKPKETKETEKKEDIAKRTEKKGEGEKPREDRPEVKTTPADNATAANNQPTRSNATRKEDTRKDDNAVAAANAKEPANKDSRSTSNNPVSTTPAHTAAANSGTSAASGNGTPPATDQKPAVANNPATNPAATLGTAAPQKEGAAVAKAGEKAVVTSNPAQATPTNNDIDPTTGDLITRKPAATKPATTISDKAAQNTPAPASSTATDAAKAAGNKPAGEARETTTKTTSGDTRSVTGSQPESNSNAIAGVAGQAGNAAPGASTTSGNTAQPVAANKPAGAAPTVAAAAALDTRTSALIRTLEVVNDSITLSFYDNGVVDGDIISVFVNGQNVIASQKLNEVAIKKTVHLTNFAADSVEVTLVAETLGSIPPNTGLVLVHDGDKRYDVRFSADMKTNASIVFRKVKK